MSPECLQPADLEALAAGLGSEQVKRHAAACMHCQAEVALFTAFFGTPATEAEAAGVKHIEQRLRANPPWKGETKPAERRWWAGAMALAGVAAALTVGVWLNRSSIAPARLPESDTLRSGQIDGVAPVGDLPQAPAAVRWNPVAGAARYQVRLIEVDQNTIWQADSSQNDLRLPEQARVQMLDRKLLYWTVTAFDQQSRTLAASTPQAFRVVK